MRPHLPANQTSNEKSLNTSQAKHHGPLKQPVFPAALQSLVKNTGTSTNQRFADLVILSPADAKALQMGGNKSRDSAGNSLAFPNGLVLKLGMQVDPAYLAKLIAAINSCDVAS